jgi:serine/threonine-protein kinase
MNESASSARDLAFSAGPPEMAQPSEGSSAGRAVSASRRAPALDDDQPTVISQRGMLPDAPSESVTRILHGRILPGERLGHFELLKYVGGGGMGKVFRALDTRLARSVALKILSPEHAADRETVLRFQNEAQSAARLDHENIARVYYVGEDRGLHYIVFEFIEGVNVRDLVESKGPLSLADAVSYTLQVADALAHAAQRNVVHRDIKPSNLLITPAGQAKLIDMGLARLREVDAAAADLTASGVTLGTFDYISPEQARDPRNTDVRSDIYSLGCTFFFMLTGRPPFIGGTMLQKLLQHQADQPPDLRQFRPELPEDVNRILRKMLAKEPRHRYTSPIELVTDLLSVARASGLRPAAPGGRTWTVPIARAVPSYYRHLPWIVSLLALVAICVALDYLWPQLPPPAGSLPPSPAIETDEGLLNAPPPGPPVSSPSISGSSKLPPPDQPSVGARNGARGEAASSGTAKPAVRPRFQSVLPILPGLEAPDRPFSPANSTAPALDPAAEKSAAEKSLIPAEKPAGDDSQRVVPKDSGEKKSALKPGQADDSSIKPAGRWISGSAQSLRVTGSL